MIDGEELIVMLDKAEMGAMQDHRNHAYCKGLRDAIKMTRVLLDAEDMDTEKLIYKIEGILVTEGQGDSRFKLGELIKYTPSEVANLLRKHANELY